MLGRLDDDCVETDWLLPEPWTSPCEHFWEGTMFWLSDGPFWNVLYLSDSPR